LGLEIIGQQAENNSRLNGRNSSHQNSICLENIGQQAENNNVSRLNGQRLR